jgi:cytoskeletal protein RodZ
LGPFGEKLRQQRETRGLTLDAISNITKISPRMLRALEEEQFDQLPGGVFNKGFVRAYARQVGLDEEETLTDYLAALRETQVQTQKILPDFRNANPKSIPIAPPSPTPGPEQIARPAGNRKDIDSRAGSADDRNRDGRQQENRGDQERRNRERRNNDRRQDVATSRPLTRPMEIFTPETLAPSIPESRTIPVSLEKPSQIAGPGAATNRIADPPTRHPAGDDRRGDLWHEAPAQTGFITYSPGASPSGSDDFNAAGASSRSFSSHTSWSKLAGLAVLLALAFGGWFLRRHREFASAAQPGAQPSSTSTPGSSTPGNISAAPVAVSEPAKSVPPVTSPLPKPRPAKSADTTPAANEVISTPAATLTKPVPAKPEMPMAAPIKTFSLLIRAEQTTWVQITADGKPIAHETLIAPAHASVRATREIVVKAGNAAGISFQLNGKEFPAQGNAGEVKTYTFDSTGLSTFPPTTIPSANQ